MSASENKKLMAEIYERLAQGDGSLFVEHLSDEAVFIMTGDNSWTGERRGKENILKFFRDVVGERAPGERKTIPTRILADGEWVVMEVVGQMTSKDGVPYRNDYCLLFRLKDGQIIEMKEYLDTAYLERVLGPLTDDPTRS